MLKYCQASNPRYLHLATDPQSVDRLPDQNLASLIDALKCGQPAYADASHGQTNDVIVAPLSQNQLSRQGECAIWDVSAGQSTTAARGARHANRVKKQVRRPDHIPESSKISQGLAQTNSSFSVTETVSLRRGRPNERGGSCARCAIQNKSVTPLLL